MEGLSNIQGIELPDILIPTYVYFVPQLLRNPLIRNAKPESHRYGQLPSQELDVYYPPSNIKPAGGGLRPPIFIFAYGGGYTWGRRQMSLNPKVAEVIKRQQPEIFEHDDPSVVNHVYHQNMGTFISARGFVTLVADYRLVPMGPDRPDPYQPQESKGDARFPSGADDLLLVLQWAVTNLSNVADTDRIFIMGHSAGANHVSTLLLLPTHLRAQPDLLRRVKKAITLSGTFYHIYSREERRRAWERYFGSEQGIEELCPFGLVKQLGSGEARDLPDLLCLHARKDHSGAVEPQGRFWGAWKERGGRGEMRECPGEAHNHMSTIDGIGCGDEEIERWLVEALAWCLEDTF